MKSKQENEKNLTKNCEVKKNKSSHEEDDVEFCEQEEKVKDLRLIPVSPGESGLGMPYAPENWPEPGDMWRWKVGKRTRKSWYQDRYLYLPERIQKLLSRDLYFSSKTSLDSYLKSQFPGTDTRAFFASFLWKIPKQVAFTTACKAETVQSCLMQHKSARTTRSAKAKLDKTNPEVTIASPRNCHSELTTMLRCKDAGIRERGELTDIRFSDYMEIIWGEVPEEKKKYFTCLEAHFFFLYGNEARKENVVDWIKKQNVTSKRYVIIPSVEGNHWRLFILCHSDEPIESNNRIKCMLLLDSLQARQSRYHFEDRLRSLVSDVYGRPENGEKIKKIPLMVPKVPLQTNAKDCGYFVLYYIKLFMESAPEIFSISDYPYFMTKNWFCSQQLECFINTLDQQYKTDTSNQESSDVSAASSDAEILFLDSKVSNAHSLP